MSERRSVGDFAVGVVATLVIFPVIGPAIGAVAVLSGLTLMNSSPSAGWSLVPLALAFGLPVAYVIAMPAAALTGLIVGLGSSLIHRSGWLYAFAAITGAVRAVVVSRLYGTLVVPMLLPIAGAAAAVICTRIARPFRPAPSVPAEPAGGGP